MKQKIKYTKKDFKIRWFSGSGAGGQHRNKHQNCCEITHTESGLTAKCTKYKSRASNEREAWKTLSRRIVAWLSIKYSKDIPINKDIIRNYNEPRNEVHDKASNFKQSYKTVVKDGNIKDMIIQRRMAMNYETEKEIFT